MWGPNNEMYCYIQTTLNRQPYRRCIWVGDFATSDIPNKEKSLRDKTSSAESCISITEIPKQLGNPLPVGVFHPVSLKPTALSVKFSSIRRTRVIWCQQKHTHLDDVILCQTMRYYIWRSLRHQALQALSQKPTATEFREGRPRFHRTLTEWLSEAVLVRKKSLADFFSAEQKKIAAARNFLRPRVALGLRQVLCKQVWREAFLRQSAAIDMFTRVSDKGNVSTSTKRFAIG